ncbi:MAG: HigA family addiction module antidote protein [Mediterranea sp.]|jgi:addiction module HigA family antidote|nr:HigA family addiction module antidote protein [Mediterranea sp.]
MEAISHKPVPYRPVHPGEILNDEVEERGLSVQQLAEQMGIDYIELDGILHAQRPITPEVALLIEATLGLNADTLVNMQTGYDMQVARKDKKLRSRIDSIRRLTAII